MLLERLAYGSNALPGIVIALSLVFFAANYASPLYQTLTLLVIAYVVRFFPAGGRRRRTRRCSGVDPRLRGGRAAASAGAPRAVFARITRRSSRRASPPAPRSSS